MNPIYQLPIRGSTSINRTAVLALRNSWRPAVAIISRQLQTTPPALATVAPITATGPPPSAPVPSAEHLDERIARRRKQAEVLKKGEELRSTKKGSTRTRRFWKDVHVKKVDDSLQIHLDSRPIRRPSKQILTIPTHKPHLATAVALEWDLLVSAQDALRTHLIPLTSLVSRALDIADEDANPNSAPDIRDGIVNMVMKYLDTDSLLCWAPEPEPDPPGYETHVSRTESLRSKQMRTAKPIIAYLTERVWPGVEIVPVLDGDSILPRSQPQMTRDIIKGWVSGLPAFELAGLERAVLAGKGLLSAVRLLVEWSPELRHLKAEQEQIFGVEEAARAASLEVDWQTEMWGEVEDTHDVDKEDVRRQFGSVVLLVSGEPCLSRPLLHSTL